MARKLARRGVPFTKEDFEDAESEGMVKAMELERDGKPVTGTAVGNAVRDMARRLQTRSRDVRLHEPD